jgi:putative ABC transport system permease protein
MEIRDLSLQLVDGIRDHLGRALASTLGIFWGAAILVVLLSWGAGFRELARGELANFGRSVVIILGGHTSSGYPEYRAGARVRMSRRHAQEVEASAADFVEAVLPEHKSYDRFTVEVGPRARVLDVRGVDARYFQYRNFRVSVGRFFTAEEVRQHQAVAVLGSEVATRLFGNERDAVGRSLRVQGESFQVVGVNHPKPRQYVNITSPENDLVLVPSTTAEDRLGFDAGDVARFLVFPRSGVSGSEAVREALGVLGPAAGFHPEDDEAVRVYDLTSYLDMVDRFYAGFLVFVGFAGTVVLLIGAVGIANYHLATLEERAHEIAIAKALGASNRRIVLETAFESILLSGIAAALGLIAGVAASFGSHALAPGGSLPTPVLSLPVLAVTLVSLIGASGVAAWVPILRVRQIEVSAALRPG